VLGVLRRRARREGIADGRSGAVAIVQRVGGALNLNVHRHALVLDGVFTKDGNVVRVHPVPRLTRDDVAQVVALIARRVARLLERRGVAGSVLAPRAAWRAARVPATSSGVAVSAGEASRRVEADGDTSGAKPSRAGASQWAELMRRTFGLDVLACPRCDGRLRLVALIEQASVVLRIVRHLGLPTEVPEARLARAPPRPLATEDQSQGAPEFDAAC